MLLRPVGHGCPSGLVVPRRAELCPSGRVVPRRAELCPAGPSCAHRAEFCPVGPSCAPSGRVLPIGPSYAGGHRAARCWRPSGRAMLEAIGPRDCSACLRDDAVVRGVEDAYHDRVADGADHDGADHEGVDARLVGADLARGRLVEGSCDALRCVCCGIALCLGFGSARRAGGVGWLACGWRRGKREGGWGIVARTVTS